ncbi:MAG: hypothetical protein JWN99_965 [Ilumatobacteraceae bacterium]|nr:hypothetical protein [Ilumatobacteraceae bacterium]
MAGWGSSPTSPQLSADRVPNVSDESTNTPAQHQPDDLDPADQYVDQQFDPDEVDRIEAANAVLEETRRRLAEAPAAVVITNHIVGLYELAAIHLGAEPPDLAQSALAIDAVACLVEGLGERIGPEAETMRDALSNIRLAFVQIKNAQLA